MSLLLKHQADVKAHWRAIASELGGVLPPGGGTYYALSEYSVAVLVCSNFPQETAARLGGTRVHVVPLLQTTPDNPPMHWLSWHEEWCTPVKGRRRHLQFGASDLTVYYGKPESPKRQLLRAEWAGVLREEGGKDIFQAPGAAHPHWHVDGIRTYFNELEQNRQTKIDALVAETVKEFDGDEDQRGAIEPFSDFLPTVPDRDELCWTGVHLAAHAKWAEKSWPGPAGPHDMHAAGPIDLPPLRRWLTSCARYLQAQIQEQLLRGRW
ncbi:MAG: hypothetical protein ACLQME_22145 [Alphaproteobacteria bacterium]